MPLNFFQAGCKTETTRERFGLCDNPDPAKDPAFIDEHDESIWIAEVQNPNSIYAEFFAIDHCPGVEPKRQNGEPTKRCDGVLRYNNNLRFVELKNMNYKGWISGARKQLTETIQFFKSSHNITEYSNVDAYIANQQRPSAVVGIFIEEEKFKDDTDLFLVIDRNIKI